MNILKISSLPRLILHYGIYAAIAHATSVLLYFRLSPELSSYEQASMLEYSIASFTCVLAGALLCFYIAKKQNSL